MLASWTGYLSPSPSTDSNSTRYSHLSLLTSSSSISSASAPSPLPSPSPSVHSIGSKTHAFFGSPFDGSPTPLPPPNPNRRSTSIKSQASIDSIASQAWTASTSSDPEASTAADETPRIEQRAPKRSLNADFFGPSLLPTPPPSAAHFRDSPSGSRDSSSSPSTTQHVLPSIPLSRLFPSRRRYGTEDDSSTDASPGFRRDFLQLDTVVPPHAYHGEPTYAEAHSASPSVENTSIASPTPLADPPDHTRTSYIHTTSESKPLPPLPPPPPVTQPEPTPLEPGQILHSASLSLRLERVLGYGAFSSVWLARDVQGQLGALELSRKTSLLRSRSEKRGRTRRLEGTRPKTAPAFRQGEGGVPMRRENQVVVHARDESDDSVYFSESGEGLKAIREAGPGPQGGRLVAVKMTERALCEKNSRTRVSFVREVEILRHISHPSIVSYVHSFSTPSHHCLVLEHIGGGELFDVIDNAESHSRLDEPLLRRMFGELCKAVGWMHGVGLVHRDIKLENILLTTSPFSSTLPSPPASLIKLSDFGLSRFIDPAHPLLTTLCGSESYAAPELVTGRPYDGRETDAWACGVVLYALATRRLPFDRVRRQVASREHEEALPPQAQERNRQDTRAERKALLIRIAKGEYTWPEEEDAAGDGSEGGNLMGTTLMLSAGVRRIVERLLVRDPKKRSKIIDLWEDEWMRGEGAPFAPALPPTDGSVALTPSSVTQAVEDTSPEDEDITAYREADLETEDDDGLIVDGEDIGPGSVAHQEH